jgi:hypothetical protein
MLSEGRYGVEIITQISAVNTALEAVAVNVLNDHDNHCVAGGLACGDEGWRPRRAASCSTPCTASPTPAENVTARPLAATVLSKLGDALTDRASTLRRTPAAAAAARRRARRSP